VEKLNLKNKDHVKLQTHEKTLTIIALKDV